MLTIIEIGAVIAFFVLLISSCFMILNFYVCDYENCKAFVEADDVAPRGTKEYTVALLGELYNDGIWALPYVGAAILTPLVLWLINAPITIRMFAIVFLISFIVTYFLFAFLGHHYVKFISGYVSNYISNPNTPTSENITASSDETTDLVKDIKDSNNQLIENAICINT